MTEAVRGPPPPRSPSQPGWRLLVLEHDMTMSNQPVRYHIRIRLVSWNFPCAQSPFLLNGWMGHDSRMGYAAYAAYDARPHLGCGTY